LLDYGVYLPFRRLDLAEIAPVAGAGGGPGTRTVASYDEDTTTMAVAALRNLRTFRNCGILARYAGQTAAISGVSGMWFATTTPAYVDKTNATAIHAALRLGPSVPAFDVGGAVRSTVGALRAGLQGPGTSLVVAADLRTGLPGSADEAGGGDGAAAVLVGEPGDDLPLLAEVVGWGSATDEFLDRWRTPGEVQSQLWEERFGEGRYLDVGVRAWDGALQDAGLTADQLDQVVIVSAHRRASASLARKLDIGDKLARSLDGTVGFTGAAHPLLALAAALDEAPVEAHVALVVLADGADVVVLRTTEALADHRATPSVADQEAVGGRISYGRYLAWRGLLPVEPPRRPEPARPSAAAAGRSTPWKFGFVGSEAEDGTVHMPPAPRDDQPRPMAQASGTIVTFTVDRLAYSPSPPVVFAVVDFDGGGRLPVELTDVDPDEVRIGGRVEPTFRKLFTADGIHNYFWKARPVRDRSERGL
jgi:hydroxymethylglutaryl-CoA synthase